MDDPGELPGSVRAAYAACIPAVREGLFCLRQLILDQAGQMPEIGPIVEDLRWGQPAFLTPLTKAACSLRIGPVRSGGFGLFVHCQSGLIPAFAAGPGMGLRYDGNRAVLFEAQAAVPALQLRPLIGQALGYHLRKRP